MDHVPGIYPGVPFLDYLAAPAVNAGLLQTVIDRCPAAAFYESWLNPDYQARLSNRAMDAGTIAHGILLEGSCERVAIIDPMRYPAKTTGAIPEGWTNQAIRQARDDAIGSGKIPILKPAMAEVEAMVDAARAFIESLREPEPNIWQLFQPGGGESELTLLWDEDGILCRMRPDRINAARTLIVDYKTGGTSAEPNTWGRVQMIRMNYYSAAAFYQRGVRALCRTSPEYVYLVQEQDPPYLCSLVGVDPQGFSLGHQKMEYGMMLWRKCWRARNWPAYPPRVMYPEIPPWEQAKWEEFESLGIPYDPAKLWEKHPTSARDHFGQPHHGHDDAAAL